MWKEESRRRKADERVNVFSSHVTFPVPDFLGRKGGSRSAEGTGSVQKKVFVHIMDLLTAEQLL